MDDEDLRGALRRYAEPVPPAPGAGTIVLGQVARRRRRRRVAGIASVALVVVGTAGVTAGLAGENVAVDPVDRAPRTVQLGGDWREIAESPLSPRVSAIAAWTGEELVVLGGMEDACPPDANCVAMGKVLADGAAYDPDTDSWREIASAPQAVHGGTAVWTGSEVVVPDAAATLAYDPVTDRWRELDAAPGGFDRGVPTDAGVAFSAYQQEADSGRPTDWLLDRESDEWTPLPRDPFGESYDRSLAWDGTRLWLLSMSVDEHGPAYGGSPSRLAVLEPGPGGIADGTWRVVDEATPDLVYEQDAWWSGGRIVVAPGPYDGAVGRTYDPASSAWAELPDPGSSPDPVCPLPAAGIGASWISGGGPGLVSTEEDAAAQVPPCPGRTHIGVAAWAGSTLLLWGGFGQDLRPLNSGLAWTPTGG